MPSPLTPLGQATLPSAALFSVRPPYTELERVRSLALLRRATLPAGAILALEVRGRPWEAGQLAQRIPELRRRFPAVPVVLYFRAPLGAEALRLARRAGALHARAVLMEGEPIVTALRRGLTRPLDLSRDVKEWLLVRGSAPPPRAMRLLGEIFERAPRSRRIRPLLQTMGCPPRTAHAWFAGHGLPSPGRWLGVAHGVHAVLRLQAEPDTSLFRVAIGCGYADHSALSRQVLRLFGERPHAVRQRLGWEWLLDRWLTRMGVQRTP